MSWKAGVVEELEGFAIYRAYKGENFKNITTIDVAQAMGLAPDEEVEITGDMGVYDLGHLDKDLKKGRSYSYYVTAKYKNGVESEKSQVLTKKVL